MGSGLGAIVQSGQNIPVSVACVVPSGQTPIDRHCARSTHSS